MNPFITSSDAAPHYQQLYRTKILPELLRRFDQCPTGPCAAMAAEQMTPPAAPPESSKVLRVFADECALCSLCGLDRSPTLISHADAEMLDQPLTFFEHELTLDHSDIGALLDPIDLFPWEECEDQNELMNIAVGAALSARRLADTSWSNATASQIIAKPSFWRSLRQADFGGLETHYKKKILSSLVQVACGRPVDTQEHRMNGMTVNFEGINLNKWNAYVFQMTAGDQDRRCSRIYFARNAQGIVLDEYDPDAH